MVCCFVLDGSHTKDWFVRFPASYSSTIFNGPGTIGLRIFSYKSHLQGTRFNHRINITNAYCVHDVIKCFVDSYIFVIS